jgi:hypothetical protein
MNSSIFSSEVGRFLTKIVLPYFMVMGLFCWIFDGWFLKNVILPAEDEGPAKLYHFRFASDLDEIPIFGNSRSNNGISPQQIAPKAWNYAINGSGCRLLRFELQAELASARKTPIVIGLDPDYLFANFFGDILDYVPLSGDTMVWQFLKAQDKAEPYFKLPTLRYYGGFERYFHRFLKNRIITSNYFASNGASLGNYRLDPKTPLPALDSLDELVGIPMFDELKTIQKLIASHPNRCFVFAETPYYRKILYLSESTGRYAYLRNKLQTMPNVVWIPTVENELPAEYFCNFTHLNAEGAAWFSNKIKQQIQNSAHCH